MDHPLASNYGNCLDVENTVHQRVEVNNEKISLQCRYRYINGSSYQRKCICIVECFTGYVWRLIDEAELAKYG